MILDENLQESKSELKISDKEIFTKIWTSPRLVFKYLNDNTYDKYVTILLVLGGITRAFDRASAKSLGDNMSLIAIFALCIVLGGLLGWIAYYIYAAILSWTGKWLNGQGNTKSLLRMIAHAMIPSIVALVLLIPQIVFLGNGAFQSNIDINGSGLVSIIIFYTTLLLEITLGIWTFVIFVIGISEVQKISIGKAILNLILSGLIILVPITLLTLIITLVR
ncbi:MAG: hypothetical protein H6Q14_2715 [Bacteroidetes bacterium]|nr:hypothetical protein [Bacteroidota bacterium]